MSGSDRNRRFIIFAADESGWADFFVTRIGIVIFAAILFLAALGIYPAFHEREARLALDMEISDISSKIEAVDSVTIPGYRYNYIFDGNDDIKIDISTEYVTAYTNLSSSIWGDQELFHPEPVIARVCPPNSYWKNSSGFRKYLNDTVGMGKNGDVSSPLNFQDNKRDMDMLFDSIRKELEVAPFSPDIDRPMFIEKVIVYYENKTEIQKRDYVFVYQ